MNRRIAVALKTSPHLKSAVGCQHFGFPKRLLAEVSYRKSPRALQGLRPARTVLAAQPEDDPVAYIQRLDALQQKLEEPADGVCFRLARELALPEMSDKVATVVQLRVGAAREFVQFMLGEKRRVTHAPLAGITSMDAEVAMAFLLVDYWRFAGHARWAMMQSLRDMIEGL